MDHIDSQEYAKNVLLLIEKKYPVDAWKVGNIDVWTFIRIRLYISILSPSESHASVIENIKPKNPFGKILTLLKIFRGYILLELFFLKLKPKKILFFGAHFHRVLHNGKYFNRFYDSIIDYHGLHNDVYMIEYLKTYKNMFNSKAILPLSKLLSYFKLQLKLRRGVAPDNEVFLEGYNQFYNDLKSIELDPNKIGLSRQDVVNWVSKMRSLEPFYLRLYDKVMPSKVVFLGYYGYDDLYAALITANALKIKTIDFQHGPQTNVHMAYFNWSKVPQNGYNTMPKEFWNWDQNSKKSIDAWANNTDQVIAKVVGQPYIAYSMRLKERDINSNAAKVILYTMQTSPLELFTPKLVKLIKKSKYKWIFRLHPRNNESVASIIRFMEDNEIKNNYIIQDSKEESLASVLAKSVIHVTNYSGCTLESIMMGVPTILIHKVGLEIFSSYFDDHLVSYLSQNESDFELKFQNLVNKLKVKDYKENYLEIFNPLTIN